MDDATADAARRLDTALQSIDRGIAVAVSGGIDSLTLATAAHALRGDVEMFHAVSAAVPGDATARVERLAAARGWRGASTLRVNGLRTTPIGVSVMGSPGLVMRGSVAEPAPRASRLSAGAWARAVRRCADLRARGASGSGA